MKKIILHSLFVLTAVTSFSVHAMPSRLQKTLDYVGNLKRYKTEQLDFFRGEYAWRKPLQWFTLASGATAGAVGAATSYLLPFISVKNRAKFSLITGGIAGVYALGKMYKTRYKTLNIINKCLDDYTAYSNLNELSRDESAMIMAAYNKDGLEMKTLANNLKPFLRKTGMCEMLAELYYRGEYDVEATDDIFMKRDMIRRRLPALKAKLGLQE